MPINIGVSFGIIYMNTIIAGIIGALGTILAPLIVIYIQKKRAEKNLIELPESRKDALAGKWIGKMNQRKWLDKENIEFDVEFILKLHEKVVFGIGKYKVNGVDVSLKGKGGFQNSRFLVFEYRNSDPYMLHFGSTILELSTNGQTLSGEFVGFGKETEDIVSGTLVFNKEVI